MPRTNVETPSKTARSDETTTFPPTPKEADAARKAKVAGLMATMSERGKAVVAFISPQLVANNRGDASVHEGHGTAALAEAAQVFRNQGWQTDVGYSEGIRGRTVAGNVIPGQYYLEVWK